MLVTRLNLSVGLDGSGVLWEVAVLFGIIDTDLNGGGPIARFRDNFGVLSMPPSVSGTTASFSPSCLSYDFETDTLHSCISEKTIK